MKAIKTFFYISIIFGFTGILLFSLNIPFRPDLTINNLLWYMVYPVTCIIFFYLVYLKKDSRINIALLKERLKKAHKNKIFIKIIGVLFVLFLPAMLVYLLEAFFGLITYYTSVLPAYEVVKFDYASCYHSYRRHSSLELNVIDNNGDKSYLSFPYYLCESEPSVNNINSKYIVLYGRKSMLCMVYDGFSFSDSFIYISRNNLEPQAFENIKNKNYVDALKYYHKAVEQGSVAAEYDLGLIYLYGQGVPIDYIEAEKWFHKAADHGLPSAQYFLGLMYHEGQGITKNYTESFKWLKKAADLEYTKAETALGYMYYDGDIIQDRILARKWFERAATKNDPDAQFGLGNIYKDGAGVQKNNAEALKWYRKSAAQGNTQAKEVLNELEQPEQIIKGREYSELALNKNRNLDQKNTSKKDFIKTTNGYIEKTADPLSSDYYQINSKNKFYWR